MIELIYQLLAASTTGVEILGDRKGDTHTNRKDVYWRIALVILTSLISAALHAIYDHQILIFYSYLPKCIVLSTGYFCGFFAYGVNIVQRRVTSDDHWWSHLNHKSWPDNWKFWRALGWEGRMIVSLGAFAASEWYYFS